MLSRKQNCQKEITAANGTLKRALAFPTLNYVLSYKGRVLTYCMTAVFQEECCLVLLLFQVFSFLPLSCLGCQMSYGEKGARIAEYHSLDVMVPMLQQKPWPQGDLWASTYNRSYSRHLGVTQMWTNSWNWKLCV